MLKFFLTEIFYISSAFVEINCGGDKISEIGLKITEKIRTEKIFKKHYNRNRATYCFFWSWTPANLFNIWHATWWPT